MSTQNESPIHSETDIKFPQISRVIATFFSVHEVSE